MFSAVVRSFPPHHNPLRSAVPPVAPMPHPCPDLKRDNVLTWLSSTQTTAGSGRPAPAAPVATVPGSAVEDLGAATLAQDRHWLPVYVRTQPGPSMEVLARTPAEPKVFTEALVHEALQGTQVYPGFFKCGEA